MSSKLINEKQAIANRLQAARKALGYRSARSFSLKNEQPVTTYRQHETGDRKLDAISIRKYCASMGVHESWLLTGSGQVLKPEMLSKITNDDFYNKLNELLKTTHFSRSPGIINDRYSIVDIELYNTIIRSVFKKVYLHENEIDVDVIIAFCLKVYNDVVSISADDNTKEKMVELACESFMSNKNKTRSRSYENKR